MDPSSLAESKTSESSRQLRALIAGDALPDALGRPRAHLQLLSDFITYHVSGTRPLDSFAFLAQMLPDDA